MDSRKSSKQHKGKAVAGSKPVLANNSPAPSSPLVYIGVVQHPPRPDPLVVTSCVGKVQGPSPTPTTPLIVHSCDGEAHSSSPARTTILENTTGDSVVVDNSVKVPSIDVANQCGVRTRNQKQRSHSGRVSPSPTKI